MLKLEIRFLKSCNMYNFFENISGRDVFTGKIKLKQVSFVSAAQIQSECMSIRG